MSDSTREALAAKLRTFIDHYDAKPSLEYIRLTRDEASDIAEALSAPAPQAQPRAWANIGREEGEVYSVKLDRDEHHDTPLCLCGSPAAQDDAALLDWLEAFMYLPLSGGRQLSVHCKPGVSLRETIRAIRAARGAGGKT